MHHNDYYEECRRIWTEEGNISGYDHNDYLTNVITTKLKGDAIEDMIKLYNQNIPNMKSLTEEYSIIEVESNSELEEVSERVCEDITSVISDLMGCHMKLFQIKLKRHKNVDKVTLPAFRWHQELHPDPMLNVMVYINDVDEGSGPFEYIVNSDGRGTIINNTTHDFPDDFIDRILKDSEMGLKVTRFLGKPGSMCIFNNNILHRGSIPTKKDRDVLLFQFRPTRKKTEKHLDWNYLNRSWDQLLDWSSWE